ncbi:hypothetical protein [Nocardia sp. NPDC057030]|uniref:hypothetical protein n=1 Tax=unclassified Nocardia TaxID=2637762 RepID=UPI00363C8618
MRDEQSTGSSEIAALAQRVETARGKLPLQHDAALFEVLSEREIRAERELAEWVRAQRRMQRRRAVEEELAAEKRDRRSATAIRRADEADARWHRRALAARRRVSSEDARLAQLYRRAEWSSRALIAVVVLGMVWAGVNVQHNLVPSGDMTDPLYWLSYGIEAMISIPIITIMVAATTAARWGRELARGKVVFFETALLGTTIALNAGPHLTSGSFGRAAEYAIAPVMVGVVIWLHAWVSARYALLIDGAPVVDRDATVIRHRVSDRDSPTELTVDAPDDRRWSLSGVDPYAATAATRLAEASPVENVDEPTEHRRDDHPEPIVAATNGHAVRSFSADPVHSADAPDGDAPRPSTNGQVTVPFSAINGHPLPVELHDPRSAAPVHNGRSTNGSAVQPDSSRHQDAATESNTIESSARTNGNTSPSNGHAFANGHPITNGRAVANGHPVTHDDSVTHDHPVTNDDEVTNRRPMTNGDSVTDTARPARNGKPVNGINRTTPPTGDATPSNGHPVDGGRGAQTNNGHAAVNGHAMQLFPVHEVPPARTDPDTGTPAPETTTDAHRGDEPEEPHPGDSIRKASAAIADTVAQAISGETVSRPAANRRKTATPDAEIEQLAFEATPEPSRPAARTEPASPTARTEPVVVARVRAEPPVEPDFLDDEDDIDEDDEITALAHEIARRGMSNLSIEQLTQIFRLADESWLTPGIANEVGVSRAAVARAVEAGIKVRRPYAISG